MSRHSASALVLWLLVAPVGAAELQDQTSREFEAYAKEATRLFLERVKKGAPPFPHDGQVIARPGRGDGILTVRGGLVHHWTASTFIAGITLDDALGVSSAYNDYQNFYKPVVQSRLLGRDGDTYRIQLRVKGGSGGVSAVLDIAATVRYFYLTGGAYSISTVDEIREVENAGTRSETRLQAGRDSGYLWRAATLNRFVARENGLFVEMESVGLSRSFPPMFGWIIEPIARRLGRRSVEQSLQEFRTAVQSRQR